MTHLLSHSPMVPARRVLTWPAVARERKGKKCGWQVAPAEWTDAQRRPMVLPAGMGGSVSLMFRGYVMVAPFWAVGSLVIDQFFNFAVWQ